jgi:hypothetical protein
VIDALQKKNVLSKENGPPKREILSIKKEVRNNFRGNEGKLLQVQHHGVEGDLLISRPRVSRLSLKRRRAKAQEQCLR